MENIISELHSIPSECSRASLNSKCQASGTCGTLKDELGPASPVVAVSQKLLSINLERQHVARWLYALESVDFRFDCYAPRSTTNVNLLPTNIAGLADVREVYMVAIPYRSQVSPYTQYSELGHRLEHLTGVASQLCLDMRPKVRVMLQLGNDIYFIWQADQAQTSKKRQLSESILYWSAKPLTEGGHLANIHVDIGGARRVDYRPNCRNLASAP